MQQHTTADGRLESVNRHMSMSMVRPHAAGSDPDWRTPDCTNACRQERTIVRSIGGPALQRIRAHHDLDAHQAAEAARHAALTWAVALLARPLFPRDGSLVRFGPVVIDTEQGTVASGGRLKWLGPHEQATLLTLARSRGRPVSYEDLADVVWPNGRPTSYRSCMRSVVKRLRLKLGAARVIVTTVHGIGAALAEAD
jgi:DNA-binding response OmpR family regulator